MIDIIDIRIVDGLFGFRFTPTHGTGTTRFNMGFMLYSRVWLLEKLVFR